MSDWCVKLFPVLQMEKLIEKNYYLHKSAQEAYKSYVRAYDSHSLKQIYSVNTLNLPMVALSFGFKVPPYVDLSILCCDLTVLHFKLHTVVFFNSEVIFMFKKSFKFCSSVFLNSTSLQTSTAVEVWRFRSAAAEEGSDTRSPTKDINPNSLSTSTKAGRETSGSSPAEPFQQNKSWTDSSSAYLKNFLLHELPVWSRVLCHVSLWHHETPVVKKYFVNVEEFLVLTSRSTEMLSFLHYTCPDY